MAVGWGIIKSVNMLVEVNLWIKEALEIFMHSIALPVEAVAEEVPKVPEADALE